jgi:hypothetical protein
MNWGPSSLSDLGLIYCAGGRAAHSFPISRSIARLCASKSANSVLALPPCSLRSPKSDRLPHFSPGGGRTTSCIECRGNIVASEKTVCFREVPIPALACSPARAPDLESAAPTETGRAAAVPPVPGGAGAWRPLPRLAFGPVSRPPLALHSSDSHRGVELRGIEQLNGCAGPSQPGVAHTKDSVHYVDNLARAVRHVSAWGRPYEGFGVPPLAPAPIV